MAKPNLEDLPEELVSNISLRLWSDDVQSLRLTCRDLERKTLHEWATEYFSEKGFIISTDSLKCLIQIANSTKLRGFLHRIYVITAYFSSSAFSCDKPCPYGHCNGWSPTIRQREAWNFFMRDQKDLKDSSRDKEMLTDALSKLPALRDISLVDSTGAVPVSVDIRLLRKVARLCGRNVQLLGTGKNKAEYQKLLSHVWTVVTSAIADSGITTLKRFGTNFEKGSNSLCVPLDIRFSDDKLRRLGNAFKSVEKLHLQITARTASNAAIVKNAPLPMQKFASTLPALQTLALDFEGAPNDNVIFANLMKHLDLSKLKKLSLNSLFTDRKTLISVFERLASIEELFMNFVNLTKGSWIPMLKQLQKMEGQLEHLHLMYLLEAGKKAYFLPQPDEDELADEEMFNEMMGGFDEGSDEDMDDEDDDDDDLPPLETMDGEMVDAEAGAGSSTAPLPATVEDGDEPPTLNNGISATSGHATTSSAPTGPSSSAKDSKTANSPPAPPEHHASDDYKAPGNEEFPERGYYVCLSGKKLIQDKLKTFIQEYNVGEDVDPQGAPPGPAMMGGGLAIPVPNAPGQPPNMNNILNGLAGYLGLPPMPGGAAGGAGGQGGGHGGHGGGHGAPGGVNNAGAAGANHAASQHGGNTANAGANHQATGGAAPGPAFGPAPPPGATGATGGGGGGGGGAPLPLHLEDLIMGGPGGEDDWDTAESSEFESGEEEL